VVWRKKDLIRPLQPRFGDRLKSISSFTAGTFRAIRYRKFAAAYSSAASISARSSQGKSLRISSFGAPAANKLRMSATVVRVPQRHYEPVKIVRWCVLQDAVF